MKTTSFLKDFYITLHDWI